MSSFSHQFVFLEHTWTDGVGKWTNSRQLFRHWKTFLISTLKKGLIILTEARSGLSEPQFWYRKHDYSHAEFTQYLFIFTFFIMWTIFKVFIQSVTILFLFYVLVSWLWGMWDLRSPIRDQTHTLCIGRWSLNHWTTREVPKLVSLLPARNMTAFIKKQ